MSSENTASNNNTDYETSDNQPNNQSNQNQPNRTTDIQELNSIIDSLEAERDDLMAKLDKVMRAYAEAENRTKRAEKDKADAIKFAPMRLAKEILDVADNFERALNAFPETDDEKLKEVFDGLSLTEKSLHQVLGRFDVKQIEINNTIFNPNFHEAVTQIPVPNKTSGEIIDVVRKGYLMGERLLRPAQVVTVA